MATTDSVHLMYAVFDLLSLLDWRVCAPLASLCHTEALRSSIELLCILTMHGIPLSTLGCYCIAVPYILLHRNAVIVPIDDQGDYVNCEADVHKRTDSLTKHYIFWYHTNSIGTCESLVPLGGFVSLISPLAECVLSQIARFMGPTWGPPGSCRPQVSPM